jgi:hypothetical protein
MQTLYALAVMALAMLLAINIYRGTNGTQQSMIVNEVATLLTGVGVDVLEHIGSYPYDSKVDTNKVATVPPINNVGELTQDGDFGLGCAVVANCEDIDDFHGKTIYQLKNQIQYTVQVEVHYVDEDDPETQVVGPTFAKEVLLKISNPNLTLGNGNPLVVEMRRVFTYQVNIKT